MTANGGEIVRVVDEQGNDRCNFAAPGFDAEEAIAQAIDQGANSLYLGPSINNLNPAIDVAQANKKQLLLFSSSSLSDRETPGGQRRVSSRIGLSQ